MQSNVNANFLLRDEGQIQKKKNQINMKALNRRET